ncbi:hypothetical protein FRB96_009680 [Tulasnella sp. 330]|nr:hypothetical protein FRB96_009680 [Tulasnella sp. 330]KAG8883314.1 hypothetical protein FRB97_006878 [Tulasnella sp. 331]
MSTVVQQPLRSGHEGSSRPYPTQPLLRTKSAHRSSSMQTLHSSSDRGDSFPSNFSSEREASQGLLFAPPSGEQSMPSPMAISKVSLIQAAGQGRFIPPPTAPRKEDFIHWEKKVIEKHWTHVKEAIEEHIGELPEEMSFPDLPPRPVAEKTLPVIPEEATRQRSAGPRHPLSVSTSRPASHHTVPPTASSQYFQRTECQRAGTCQCPKSQGMSSAPATIPVFAMNTAPPHRRGSLPIADSGPVAFVPYLPAPPPPVPHQAQRSQTDSLAPRPGFIPTVSDLAWATTGAGNPVHAVGYGGMIPMGGYPQRMQVRPVGVPGSYMVF